MKKWVLKPSQKIPSQLKTLKLNPATLQLLIQRGLSTREKIDSFLNTSYEALYSPLDLNGVREAVERIVKAKKKQEKIVIYGDYDADGTTSAALLKEVLEEVGVSPAGLYIPDRNKEGYGLNCQAIDYLKLEHGADLIITVDCGISNREEIKYARQKGIEVIVTDHHSIPEKIPQNCVIINPKLENQNYPFKDLAGVGVVFKLAQALYEKIIPEKVQQLKWFLDIVAIGTIADCVPLLDENRALAKFGLIVLQKTKRIGLQEILKVARINIDEKNPPSTYNISFQIGPRLNAAGRMDHADLTLNLLTEGDRIKARLMALEVEKKNTQRQKITNEIYLEVKKTLDKEKEHRLILKSGKNWPAGVVGIVAGKLCEDYNCPVFLFREEKGIFKGSGRSINDFNIIAAVRKIDHLVGKYGGHAQAMGLEVKKENFKAFEASLLEIIDESYDEESWGRKTFIDIELDSQNIDWDLFSEIRKFEPYGEGNEEPVFLSRGLKIREVNTVGNGQKHLKFVFETYQANPKSFEGIFFGGGNNFSKFAVGNKVDAVYNLRSNSWNGRHKLSLNIIDIKMSG